MPVEQISAGLAGLVLMNTLLVVRTLQRMLRASVELELSMNAVERVQYYTTELPREAAIEDKELGVTTAADWPAHGAITFHSLTLRYRPELPDVVHGLDLVVPAGCKLGLCGRTGSGKSTLGLALFRLLEAREGSIHIDGVDIASRGLKSLRSRLGMVPQQPTLFQVACALSLFSSFMGAAHVCHFTSSSRIDA
jgi:ABC-type multidrug transport system fused ATPase/permease subunit